MSVLEQTALPTSTFNDLETIFQASSDTFTLREQVILLRIAETLQPSGFSYLSPQDLYRELIGVCPRNSFYRIWVKLFDRKLLWRGRKGGIAVNIDRVRLRGGGESKGESKGVSPTPESRGESLYRQRQERQERKTKTTESAASAVSSEGDSSGGVVVNFTGEWKGEKPVPVSTPRAAGEKAPPSRESEPRERSRSFAGRSRPREERQPQRRSRGSAELQSIANPAPGQLGSASKGFLQKAWYAAWRSASIDAPDLGGKGTNALGRIYNGIAAHGVTTFEEFEAFLAWSIPTVFYGKYPPRNEPYDVLEKNLARAVKLFLESKS